MTDDVGSRYNDSSSFLKRLYRTFSLSVLALAAIVLSWIFRDQFSRASHDFNNTESSNSTSKDNNPNYNGEEYNREVGGGKISTKRPDPRTEGEQPTFLPATIPPTLIPTKQPFIDLTTNVCVNGDQSRSDRIGHNEILYPGMHMCSVNRRYRMGLDIKTREFTWRDELEDRTLFVQSDGGGHHFRLTESGVFVLYGNANETEVKWTSNPRFAMYPTRCLGSYDCPYLHLHNGGVCVVNWIDENYRWQEQGFWNVYDESLTWTSVIPRTNHHCRSNVLFAGTVMERGEVICCGENGSVSVRRYTKYGGPLRWSLGINNEGTFFYTDTETDRFVRIVDNSIIMERLVLAENNLTIHMYDFDNNLVRFLEPKKSALIDIAPSHLQCSSNNEDNCPFLKLRNDGVVIVGWTDSDGQAERVLFDVLYDLTEW